MRRRHAVVTALVALLAVGGGATAWTMSHRSDPLAYVAVGDSYTAGPQIPTQVGSPAACGRSDHGYPALLADRLHATSFTNVSCAGASPANVTQAQVVDDGTNPPQLDAVTATTQLVTVGLGANDQNVFWGLMSGCAGLAASDPSGSPCTDHFTAGGTDQVAQKLAVTRTDLVTALEQVRAKAPGAVVVVVGYPRMLPATGSCSNVQFAPGDYAYVTRWGEELNAALEAAAQATGAHYVDTWSASTGHDACSGNAAWVNGSTAPADSAAYHPTPLGMAAEADLVRTYLEDNHLLTR